MDYKAPWTYNDETLELTDRDGVWFASCGPTESGRLIAAAPELLAALHPFAALGILFTDHPGTRAVINVSMRDLRTALTVYRKASGEDDAPKPTNP